MASPAEISGGVRAGGPMDRRWRSQPHLVDGNGCLCRVDANPKNKRLVAGPRLCRQSSVKPSIHPAKQREQPQRHRSQTLIPGLPDDLAVACLVRVPRTHHRKLRLVCRKWRSLLVGSYFHALRRSAGIAEEWLYVIKRDRDGKVLWEAFDPLSLEWHPLPPVPPEYSAAHDFGCAVLGGCHLYLFGGRDPSRGSMRRVVFYNARTNKWHRAPDMLRRRHLFGYCVIDERLYVAGGEGDLRTAEMYDPGRRRWVFVSETAAPVAPGAGGVYGGRWYLRGRPLGGVYLPESDTWQGVSNGLLAGWRKPSVCLGGRLYAADCSDGCRLRVYDEATDTWRTAADSGTHAGSSAALEAAGLVALNGKLCVVRNNMSVTMVDVGSDGGGEWETVAGSGLIRTFVTNLWSNIAGRAGLRHRVLHCQVLQA